MRHSAATLAGLALALGLASAAIAQIASEAPQGGGDAPTLRELVDRYRDWRGGFALESLQSIHERVYVESASGRQAGQLWLDREGRMRRETTADGGRVVEVATPGGGWRAGPAAPPADDPKAVERARRLSLLVFGDALAGRGGASVALAGTAEMEDRSWMVARVSFGDADTYDALIDPTTGALCCYEITEDGVKRVEMFGDWRLVDGVRMPFTELIHPAAAANAIADVGMRVSAIELNLPLDPTLFQRPAG
jgi:hypothetical protein